ncbi:uncharacterized protein LOC132728961 [Ruditapes philippinarum]|uniref:uncharacterized protein LOC132728961 n=1 Tax=Ruditapes philippinarum TaxID=129788 RepID=UPI00295BB2E1|nr:uncharacterized protein LOC132728961 [Ruditapes philippinarum]
MDLFIKTHMICTGKLFSTAGILYACVLFLVPGSVLAKDCLGRDQCSCAFDDDGSLIVLNSLGNSDLTPRFQDVSSSDGSTYSYNPCYPFTEGTSSCTQAAACITSVGQTESIGDAQSAKFAYSEDNDDLELGYTSGSGLLTITQVKLKCDQHACQPSLTAEGNQGLNQYALTLTTVCACPNGCNEDGPINCTPGSSSGGIGGGAVVLIIFFAFLFIYFVGGTVFLAVGRKARGKEMVPNVTFWSSLPGLVKDGVLFTLSPVLGKRSGYVSK